MNKELHSKKELGRILFESCHDFFDEHDFSIYDVLAFSSLLLVSTCDSVDISDEQFIKINNSNLKALNQLRAEKESK